jgi:hypothetical protein
MCASRIQQREKPEIRTVEVGGRKVPYWEAGNAYLPYSQGYFPGQGSAVAAVTWAFDTHAIENFGHSDLSGGSVGDFGFGGDFSSGGDFGGGGDSGL